MNTPTPNAYWYADEHNNLLLIEATGRKAANELFEKSHGIQRVQFSAPAVCCPICGCYKPVLGGYMRHSRYIGYTPCEQDAPGHKAPIQPG